MKVRPSALIWRQNANQAEVLLMRYNYGGQDVYALPGGNPDRGEILTETVVREIQEELGVSVDVGEMILAGEMLLSQRNDDVLHIVFATRNLQGQPALNPAETTAHELVWQPVDVLDKLNMYPNIGAKIQPWFRSATYLGYVGRIEQQYFG
ncbi:NUDIX hydrolase [Spirosoma sp. RP8]|uniref:NUDIX hydrolase n=1 Tax=Spirosoma liriopis TaxID=2937440 RepID=A0ABT0HJ23_9BACT|nr:NUDIX hydrolase [Spirosoma liriopis]MCK8492163.1 NUDIX hydrolase [Spirosoma liriopis]